MTSPTPPPAPGPQAPPPPTDPQPPSPGGPAVAQFFDRIRSFGAVRPDDGRWAAGVAAGLARRWGVDPLLVRGAFVVLALVGGIGLLLYGLGWLFLPHPDGRIHAQEVLGGTVTAGFVGGLLSVLVDLGGSGWRNDGWGPQPFGSGFFVVALVALAVWWFATGRHRGQGGQGGQGGPWTPAAPAPADPADPADPASASPTSTTGSPDEPTGSGHGGTPTAPLLSTSGTGAYGATAYGTPAYGTPTYAGSGYGSPPYGGAGHATAGPVPVRMPRPDPTRPSRAWTRSVLGVAVLAAAAVLLVDRVAGFALAGGVVATVVALGVVALGVLVAGLRGRRSGGLAPIGIVLAIVAAGSTATTEAGVTWAGDRTWTPDRVAGQVEYTLGVGDATLDLGRLTPEDVPFGQEAPRAPEVRIEARVGVGALTVVVPEGVRARIVADTGNGDVRNEANLTPTPSPVQTLFGAWLPPGSREGDLDVVSATDVTPTVLVRAEVGAGQITIVRSR